VPFTLPPVGTRGRPFRDFEDSPDRGDSQSKFIREEEKCRDCELGRNDSVLNIDERPAHVCQICGRARVNSYEKSLQQAGVVANREVASNEVVMVGFITAISAAHPNVSCFSDGYAYQKCRRNAAQVFRDL
jgi:hypothetical protein